MGIILSGPARGNIGIGIFFSSPTVIYSFIYLFIYFSFLPLAHQHLFYMSLSPAPPTHTQTHTLCALLCVVNVLSFVSNTK